MTNLELDDSVSNRDFLRSTPDKSIHFDGTDSLLDVINVDGVIPWLDVVDDVGLSDRARLLGLLLGVSLQSLFGDSLLFLIIFIFVRSEKVKVFILSRSSSWLRSRR